jgi:hypothetical protein
MDAIEPQHASNVGKLTIHTSAEARLERSSNTPRKSVSGEVTAQGSVDVVCYD